jgi:hypothetical protein
MVPLGALNVPPEIVKFPSISAPFGKESEPEEMLTVFPTGLCAKDVNPLRLSVAPLMVNPWTLSAVNPDMFPPVEKVESPPPLIVRVPVPLKVLLISAVLVTVGLLPTDKVPHPLKVFVAEPVAFIITLLKDSPLQVIATVLLPSKVIVPPFELNVVLALCVNEEAMVISPDGAVNVPDVKLSAPLKSTVV